jgi:hypothetical protein
MGGELPDLSWVSLWDFRVLPAIPNVTYAPWKTANSALGGGSKEIPSAAYGPVWKGFGRKRLLEYESRALSLR